VNDMEKSMDTVGQPPRNVEEAMRTGIDRRTMLKAAAAAGVFAGTWVAPRIETLGFAPAGAMTQCIVTNEANQDLNSNQSNNTYVSTGFTQCTDTTQHLSFGNQGNSGPDEILFKNPTANCTSITVQTAPADCNTTDPNRFDPDQSGFKVFISATNGTGCSNCKLVQVVIFNSNRTTIFATFTALANGTTPCGTGTPPAILVQLGPSGPPGAQCITPSDARLAARLSCSGVQHCT